MMKVIERIIAGILMVSMLFVLLISAVEIAVYTDYGYFGNAFARF